MEIAGVLKRQPKTQIKKIQKVLTKEIEKIKREKTKLLKLIETTQDEEVGVDWYATYIEDKEKMFDLERNIRDAERFIMLSKCLFENA